MTEQAKLRKPRLALFGWLLVLFTLIAAPGFARAASLDSAGFGLPFAVADFDGDQRPDVASIQPAQAFESSNDYWVGLRLSAFGQHYIRIAAPTGGLRMEARDVNGDNRVDLVFASERFGQTVAVLLNDGHGNFSQADPATFARAFVDSRTRLGSEPAQFADVQALTERPSEGRLAPAGSSPASDDDSRLFACFNLPFVPTSSPVRFCGRAPPASVLL